MTALEKALYELQCTERQSQCNSFMHRLDPRAKIIVTLFYIIVVLSFSLESLTGILICWIYPIIGSTLGGISYSSVFRKSLIVLPFVAFIGIFNPIYNTVPALYVGNIAISRGWIEFMSIIIRGLLSAQAAILLIMTTGFYRVCRALGRLGVPSVFTTQLLLVYRYIYVLLDEAIDMERARQSRGYGRKGYGLRMWGRFIGQLLLRTVERSERVHRAMLSRGFDGRIRSLAISTWCRRDTLFLLSCCAAFVVVRVCRIF